MAMPQTRVIFKNPLQNSNNYPYQKIFDKQLRGFGKNG
jgi:hypothetical protein